MPNGNRAGQPPYTDVDHFIVLPDAPGAADLLPEEFEANYPTILSHPSGRPWLLTNHPQSRIEQTHRPHGSLALIGYSQIQHRTLADALDRTVEIQDVQRSVPKCHGSFHVLATIGSKTWSQGTATGTRRVYHTVIGELELISDRADVLASIGGYDLDAGTMALRLVRDLPYPLDDIQMWEKVRAVPPDHAIVVGTNSSGAPSHRSHYARWWTRPYTLVQPGEAAEALGAAVASSVSTRLTGEPRASCDLSGGLDSTPLCYYAAHQVPTIGLTAFNNGPGGHEDSTWVEQALPTIPIDYHLKIDTDTLPQYYGSLTDEIPRVDSPMQAYIAAPRIISILRQVASLGSKMHLHGLGGDQVLSPPIQGIHHHASRAPLQGFKRIRRHHRAARVGLAQSVGQTLDRKTYSSWLRWASSQAEKSTSWADSLRVSDWSYPYTLPSWLSTDARNQILLRLREASSSAEPLEGNRLWHVHMYALRSAAREVRAASQVASTFSRRYEGPLLDDRVVEAALSAEQYPNYELLYKPLMKASLKGQLPQSFLERNSKIGGFAQAAQGFGANTDELLDICSTSLVNKLGLINMHELERVIRTPYRRPNTFINETLNLALFTVAQSQPLRRLDR